MVNYRSIFITLALGSTAVELSTYNPKIKGLNLANGEKSFIFQAPRGSKKRY
jgi:hypothetical protein